MGIFVNDMLRSEAFKDYELIAGQKGLDKQIKGIAIMDAPDGLQWTHGHELLLTTGYVFYKNPGLINEFIASEDLKKISAVGIKIGRFINHIPDYVVEAFNEHNIPLIRIPLEHSWMYVTNQLNVLVMNNSIRQFNIRNINPSTSPDLPYQTRKVHKILSQMEKAMNFPAMLYDVSNEKTYYSSPSFLKMADHLELENFWNPAFEHEKEILSNNFNMTRYRVLDKNYDKPFSWITVPITVGNKVKAYFVVVEATELIDYFNQFSLVIGFILLQSLYEQMLLAQNIGDAGFENFVADYLSGYLLSDEMITKRAKNLDIDTSINYYVVLMTQTNKAIQLADYKDIVKNTVNASLSYTNIRMANIDENYFVFLISEDKSITHEQNLTQIEEYLEELDHRLERKIANIKPLFGISDRSGTIYEMKKNYSRCEKTISNGKLLFPDRKFLVYSELGPFAWMDIPEEEIEMIPSDLKELFRHDENKVLLETLKVYLDCKMNYSQTAKKLYVHINTVRKRIQYINDKTSLDLEDPLNRLKLEVLLKLFN